MCVRCVCGLRTEGRRSGGEGEVRSRAFDTLSSPGHRLRLEKHTCAKAASAGREEKVRERDGDKRETITWSVKPN